MSCYRYRKSMYARERCQQVPLKKRKFSDHSFDCAYDQERSSDSISNLPEKGTRGDKNSSNAIFCRGPLSYFLFETYCVTRFSEWYCNIVQLAGHHLKVFQKQRILKVQELHMNFLLFKLRYIICANDAEMCYVLSVKFSIKSFMVPELYIEVPETATVGSLKVCVLLF